MFKFELYTPIETFDAIRWHMLFRRRFRSTRKPSRIAIKGANKQIYFLDLGNAELKPTPLEKTVYLLFLDHPEVIHIFNQIDHIPKLEKINQSLGISSTVAELKKALTSLSIRPKTPSTKSSVAYGVRSLHLLGRN